MSETPVRVMDDHAWGEIMAATKGAAAPCFSCGVCTAVCPWGLVRKEPVNVRKLIRRTQLGLDGAGEDIWLCTTCGACEALCPRGVQVSELILGLRALAWKKREVPKGLPALLWAIHWDGNPWDQPPSQRAGWARGLDVKPFDADDDVLLYVGCTAAYDRRSQKVARSVVRLLRAAGVSFGILPDEPCCGESVRTAGQAGYLDELIRANVRRFEEVGVRTLVAISPHCFDMFKCHYPVRDGFRPLHSTEYLAELVKTGRLAFTKDVRATVTYHDPCYLGRRHGIYEAPRTILGAIHGIELVDMPSSREDGLCCGGGGGRMWLETRTNERFGDLRIAEARRTGASILASSCPFCLLCLEDSAKVLGAEALRVMDVTELAAQALEPSS